jgi:hypothetical protein
LALNHFYWAGQYIQTAATEANAVVYNQLTAGVFSTLYGYGTLCQELDLEPIKNVTTFMPFTQLVTRRS